jgi:hypothetical protein
MCTCNNNSSCSCGSLITTSKGNTGPTGAQGPTGPAGADGADGIVSWADYDLGCWMLNGITTEGATNEEITQDFIDAFCEVHQIATNAIAATDDYVFTDMNVVLNINPITNDLFFPTVTVTLGTVVNGTATVDVDNHTIIFTPDLDYTGTAIIPYTITDTDGDTSSANVYVNVVSAVTTQSIEDTVETTLITLLSSDEYWDLGLPIGTKLLISNSNLGDFTTTGITAGKGIVGTKWAKWAICNGNMTNGVDDMRLRNLRGFDYADGAGNDVAGYHDGSDAVSLDITNIPPHKHKYTENETYNAGGSNGTIENAPVIGDWKNRVNTANTGDGTDNVSNELELQATPDPVDVTNAYVTVIVVQKIA